MDNSSTHVVIYNTEKRELIGIFSSISLVIRYLFEITTNSKKQSVYNAFQKKSKVYNTIFKFPVAIRRATDEHISFLGNSLYKIINDYPLPRDAKMNGFCDTKESLYSGWMERVDRRVKERNRQNNIDKII